LNHTHERGKDHGVLPARVKPKTVVFSEARDLNLEGSPPEIKQTHEGGSWENRPLQKKLRTPLVSGKTDYVPNGGTPEKRGGLR